MMGITAITPLPPIKGGREVAEYDVFDTETGKQIRKSVTADNIQRLTGSTIRNIRTASYRGYKIMGRYLVKRVN
jgi:hypothetical protein